MGRTGDNFGGGVIVLGSGVDATGGREGINLPVVAECTGFARPPRPLPLPRIACGGFDMMLVASNLQDGTQILFVVFLGYF